MIHITLGPVQTRNPEVDDIGRSWFGYREGASDQELYQANRCCWVLGERANGEHYALFSQDGVIRFAVEIERVDPAPKRPHRKVITGKVLGPGHEVYDTYVGGPALSTSRNPVEYVESTVGLKKCRCGCGEDIARGDFKAGHDQRALHERVAQIGTVAEFCDWFDTVRR